MYIPGVIPLALKVEMIASPVVKILSRKSKSNGSESGLSFYALAGDKILFKALSADDLNVCLAHPENKKWVSVAALSADEKLFAVCDCEKNLYLYEISSADPTEFTLKSVPMRLAKTATSVKFTAYPSEWTILVADKFGDVLRFQVGEEFERWAQESHKNAKSLSIHSKSHGKRSSSESNDAALDEVSGEPEDGEEEGTSGGSSEAHHCTIIGHISMITDLQVLSIESPVGGVIVTCDRDEKVRLTRADRPEIIHSFGLGHREFVGTLAVNDANGCIYSAGGDKYIAEWKVEADSLSLIEKISLKEGVDGVVQEIKVDLEGKNLFAHVEGFGMLHYVKTNESSPSWSLEGSYDINGITAFEINHHGFFAASWSPESGILFHNISVSVSEETRNEIACSVEEATAIIDSMSKSKLKKDVERMDWKQKKHFNQKPRGE